MPQSVWDLGGGLTVDNAKQGMINNLYDAAWLDERGEYFKGLRLEIMELKFQGVFQQKNIAIAGCWNNAGEIYKIMRELGLELTHIADNNPNKQNVSRLGIISQSVESLKETENIVILVLNNIFWKELQFQLTNLGFEREKDFYILFGGCKFKKLALQCEQIKIAEDEWKKYCARVEKGYRSYCDIQKKYDGLPVWLMHQPSLGDLYIFSLFLPYAMGVDSVSKCECVLIVTKNSVKKLAEVIGFRHIELVTFEEANKNWLMLMRLAGDKLNVKNAVYHGLSDVFQTLVHYSTVSFRDSFTKYVFQFKNEVSPIYPQFPKRKDYVLRQFEKYGLLPGKTVLISPYAGHFTAEISDENWRRMIAGLKSKGYTVCTNCGSADEKALPGTAAPFIELCDSVEFAETAGYFIGVRSGFCDLICMAECRKIVIYETGAPAASISYFGFESMGIGKNITEIVNDCIHKDEMIDCILAMFQ